MVNTPVLGTGDLGSIPSAPIGDKYLQYSVCHLIMSLLSQQDREIVIKALEDYSTTIQDDEYYLQTPKYSSFQINTLLNWIKLEYSKNAN
jgi:uncharacterized protein YcgL (UPF0745 family)